MSKKARHGTQSFRCQHCGEVFYASHPNARYCGERCSKAAYRARKNATKTGLEGFNTSDLDTFNTLRSVSEHAAEAIMHIRRIHGLHAARTMMWACWCVMLRDDVNPAERPYQLDTVEIAARDYFERLGYQ
jgi:hypothetical protein